MLSKVTIIKRVGVGILISDSRIQSKEKYQKKMALINSIMLEGLNILGRHYTP